MSRLLWLSSERADPEESFPALLGRRPAPEPVPFSEATAEFLARRLVDVILVDGRGRVPEASAAISKVRSESDIPCLLVLGQGDLEAVDWSSAPGDFVVEPCTPAELEARIARLSAPPEVDTADITRRGEITIDRGRFEVRVRGQTLDLTYKEFELLAYLVARPGRVCTRSTLLQEVWGYDFFGGTRTVDVHIRRLRAKLGQESNMIETVRNVGYRFAG